MKNYCLVVALGATLMGCSSIPNQSPIQSDPSWATGQLDNGLTYHVYRDREAPVSVRLVVHAGSFQETDQQKGYAHFVEHMAFNGSENFSQNDVIRLFEDAGVSFGADLNAYTSYQETVYLLDLPDNSQLTQALTWMRDIGDGLEIASSEVEKEKGVILGEFRYAQLEDKQLADNFYDYFIQGGQYQSKDALGTKDSVMAADQQGLRGFYQTWYQPQLVEVVVAGDINKEEAVALIDETFADWERGQTVRPEKQRITSFNEDDFVEYVKGGESPSITLMFNRGLEVVETHEQQHQRWLDGLSQRIIEQRLNSVFNEAALPTQWIISERYSMEYQRYSLTSVAFPVGSREVSQQQLISTLASLRDYGVSENEIASEVQYYVDWLQNVEREWDNMNGLDFANYKVGNLVVESTMQSPRDEKASLEVFVEQLNLDTINTNIRDLLSSDYFLVLGVDRSEDKDAIEQTTTNLKAAYAAPGVQTIQSTSDQSFAVPITQGEVVLVEQMYADPYIQKWTLSNGVDMWYLRDTYANDEVGMYYTSLGGKMALDPSLYPAAEVAIATIARSGVGNFNGSELEAHLDRESIELYSFIDSTRHGIEFKFYQDEIKEAFGALNAIATSPNVSPKQLEAVKQEFNQGRTAYLDGSMGQFEQAMNHNTFQENSSHYLIDGSAVAQVSVEQVRRVHQALFDQDRHTQLVIVGDIDPSILKPLVSQYVASIPLKESEIPEFSVAYRLNNQKRVDLSVNTEQSSEYILRVVSELPPSSQGDSAKEVFMSDLMQRILTTRLDAYVREELSLDYSPYAYAVSQDGERSSDWFIGANITPTNAEKVEAAIDKVMADLLNGITEEEVRAVGKQLENDFAPLDANPVDQAWFVSRYIIHDFGVEALFDVKGMVNSISSKDMNEHAQRLFGENSRYYKNILRPAQ
ncbi:insulinase family protein [Vibrio sp. D404a]|uniref:M16 family metallopeptidase n=1 Tax=unclassified Vibrio TaxID=2614977 RepID=UPI0025579C2F|nr:MULTISPECIES: M16 family metallopeptidase [unclassified Vibrio]MDK9739698.1 insulinase family protein [Vibrio sp. D404a]MDK9799696.1 insulinase family protein [Vibrio sp. D449a]